MKFANLLKTFILITVFTIIGLFFYNKVSINNKYGVAFIAGMLFQLIDNKTEVV